LSGVEATDTTVLRAQLHSWTMCNSSR